MALRYLKEYKEHKKKRFLDVDQKFSIAQQEAFVLKDMKIRDQFKKEYLKTATLYYQGQISFDEILSIISQYLARL